MCGRFAFYSPHEAVVRLFGLPDDTPGIEPRYNVAPTTFIPAVRELPDEGSTPDVAATRRLALLYWGLVPVWAKEKSIGARMTNARAETLQGEAGFPQRLPQAACAGAGGRLLRVEDARPARQAAVLHPPGGRRTRSRWPRCGKPGAIPRAAIRSSPAR